MARTIHNTTDLPADGCITVRRWDGSRRRGWHIEKVVEDFGGGAFVIATPMNIATGRTSGEPQYIHLRFGLDEIQEMPS